MGKNIIEIKSKNGTVYLCEDKSYWDKEKGYSTHERTCIGKKGADGNPIYNKYYKAREEMQGLAAEVELYFDDEKNLLDLRRLKNHNEQTVKGKIFVTFISLVILSQLRKMVDKVDKKKRKYWSEHDMLRKVETYAKIHFDGKYKDVYTTPTPAQRLVFDIFGIPYAFKGKDSDPKGNGK